MTTATADRVVAFELELTTADECYGTSLYRVDEQGVITNEADEWDEEPELQTEHVGIHIVHASGKRAGLDLTGDQHRDLENYAGYDSLFARIVAGEEPQKALDTVLADCCEPPRRPRP